MVNDEEARTIIQGLRRSNVWHRKQLAVVALERDELLAACEDLLAIVRQSEGVAGYHLNGEVARWDELKAVAQMVEAVNNTEPKRKG